MGAPYNHLQQLKGLGPARKIGTDDLKHFYFAIEATPFAVGWNVKVSKIFKDRVGSRLSLNSGSFFPAVSEEPTIKEFISGDQVGAFREVPRFAMTFTGGPVEAPRDVSRMAVDYRGAFYQVALELGYINVHNIRGKIERYYHEEAFINFNAISGNLIRFDKDELKAQYFFLTGTVWPEHVATKYTIAEADAYGVVNYFLMTGKYQGG
jgi:hypothetical protein